MANSVSSGGLRLYQKVILVQFMSVWIAAGIRWVIYNGFSLEPRSEWFFETSTDVAFAWLLQGVSSVFVAMWAEKKGLLD